MKPEIKTKWLEALRSNRYPQGQRHLAANGMYCCLGVLCDVVNPKGWGSEFSDIDAYPPMELLEEVRLDYQEATRLASQNDDGDSFLTIADYIEKYC